MTSSNGNIFRVTGHLCVEFTGEQHKGQWRGALMFSLICVWINGWVNNGEAGDLRRYRAHYAVTVMTREHSHMSTVSEIHLCMTIYLFKDNSCLHVSLHRWTFVKCIHIFIAAVGLNTRRNMLLRSKVWIICLKLKMINSLTHGNA